MPTGLQIPFPIYPVNPILIDGYEGPYTSVAAANAAIPIGVRRQTRFVKIIDAGIGKLYWFKDGITDIDLVEFTGSSTPQSLQSVTDIDNITTNELIHQNSDGSRYAKLTHNDGFGGAWDAVLELVNSNSGIYKLRGNNNSGENRELLLPNTDGVLIATINGNAPDDTGNIVIPGVTSVSGTANRITVVSGTTLPVINISTSYVGQTSITTLGTITTGTWQGSGITDSYISSATKWNGKQNQIILTTTGSGAATFTEDAFAVPTLNIPDYSTLIDNASLNTIEYANDIENSGDTIELTFSKEHTVILLTGSYNGTTDGSVIIKLNSTLSNHYVSIKNLLLNTSYDVVTIINESDEVIFETTGSGAHYNNGDVFVLSYGVIGWKFIGKFKESVSSTPTLSQVLSAGNNATGQQAYLTELRIKLPFGSFTDLGGFGYNGSGGHLGVSRQSGDEYADLDPLGLTFGGRSSFSRTILKADNLTGDDELQLPNGSGTLVKSVNGNAADNDGNVVVTGAGFQSLNDTLTIGNTTTQSMLINSSILFATSYSVLFGRDAGLTRDVTGDYLVAIGALAGSLNEGTDCNFIGQQAGYNNIGNNVSGIGQNASKNNTGSNVCGVGQNSASDNEGDYVNAYGFDAASGNHSSHLNAFGKGAGAGGNVIGVNCNAFGQDAAGGNEGDGVNAFGKNSAYNNTFNNVSLFGEDTTALADNQFVIKGPSTYQFRLDLNGLTADANLTIPNISAKVLAVSVNGNFADANGDITISTGGAGSYIDNGTSLQTSADFNIDGTGVARIYEVYDPVGSQTILTLGKLNTGGELYLRKGNDSSIPGDISGARLYCSASGDLVWSMPDATATVGNKGRIALRSNINTGLKVFTFPDYSGSIYAGERGNYSASLTAQTTVNITIIDNGITNYYVDITPKSAMASTPWYISAQTTSSFTITYTSAVTGTVAFDWKVVLP